jgi:Cu(I)/Ag(I) efflux system membrane fusion protein
LILMNFSKSDIYPLAGGAGLLLLGLLLGALFFGGGSESHAGHDAMNDGDMSEHVQEEHTDAQGNVIYTCSMHPNVRQDEPGDCPICGMDLIPASSGEAGDEPAGKYEMQMSQAAVQLASIQTTPVRRGVAARELHLPGRIELDERRRSVITSKVEGRITELHVDFTGAPVAKGQPVASIYSPELMSAQRELLQAVEQRESQPERYASALRKLRLWEIPESEIQRVLEAGEVQQSLQIHSPADGYVTQRHVSEESYVQPGTVLFDIADAGQLWLSLEAYEEDMQWLSEGDRISFSPRGSTARHEARISFIDPAFDVRSRSIRLRADVSANQAGSGMNLRPGMLVSAVVEAELPGEQLMVPASSVLWTGPRSLVYVQQEQQDENARPRFQVREVVLGPRAGDFYVIENHPEENHGDEAHHPASDLPESVQGIQEGEQVVFNGAFHIDSEMQLADRFSMMNREPGSGSGGGDQHGNMDGMEGDSAGDTAEVEAADGVSAEFRQEFTTLLERYLDAKNALFDGNESALAQALDETATALEAIGKHRNEGDAHMQWMQDYEALGEQISAVQRILGAEDPDHINQEFAALSDQLIKAVRRYGIEGVVYHQYCPMEDKNWLSSEEEIQNPYAPQHMPRCGEVVERIER